MFGTWAMTPSWCSSPPVSTRRPVDVGPVVAASTAWRSSSVLSDQGDDRAGEHDRRQMGVREADVRCDCGRGLRGHATTLSVKSMSRQRYRRYSASRSTQDYRITTVGDGGDECLLPGHRLEQQAGGSASPSAGRSRRAPRATGRRRRTAPGTCPPRSNRPPRAPRRRASRGRGTGCDARTGRSRRTASARTARSGSPLASASRFDAACAPCSAALVQCSTRISWPSRTFGQRSDVARGEQRVDGVDRRSGRLEPDPQVLVAHDPVAQLDAAALEPTRRRGDPDADDDHVGRHDARSAPGSSDRARSAPRHR